MFPGRASTTKQAILDPDLLEKQCAKLHRGLLLGGQLIKGDFDLLQRHLCLTWKMSDDFFLLAASSVSVVETFWAKNALDEEARAR